MYWNEIIELGMEEEITIDMETTKEYTWSKYFANKIRIRQSEQNADNQLGLKPNVAFEVRAEEFKGQTAVRWKDKTYQIVRTDDNQKNATVELYLSTEISALDEHN